MLQPANYGLSVVELLLPSQELPLIKLVDLLEILKDGQVLSTVLDCGLHSLYLQLLVLEDLVLDLAFLISQDKLLAPVEEHRGDALVLLASLVVLDFASVELQLLIQSTHLVTLLLNVPLNFC